MFIIEADHPIHAWLDEQSFYEKKELVSQAMAIANMPMVHDHVALMPDAHVGYGMPIGGVMPLEGWICPAAVGYDIGCGMYAFETNLTAGGVRPHVERILNDILRRIPCGKGGVVERARDLVMPAMSDGTHARMNDRIKSNLAAQLGTLGGGNHFIEICFDTDDKVWVVIHSGSRGVGHAFATIHMKVAQDYCSEHGVRVPKDLAVLPVDSAEGRAYIEDMDFSLDWALINRATMAREVQIALVETFESDVCFEYQPINVHHNYASFETFSDGVEVVVHRKGATRANTDELAVIPGHMGIGSYIVRGLGNEDSFCSSSHGAGRRLGRGEAKRTLDLDEQMAKLRALGVTYVSASRDGSAVEEAPDAYKPFDTVMALQADLVATVMKLTPMGVVKG